MNTNKKRVENRQFLAELRVWGRGSASLSSLLQYLVLVLWQGVDLSSYHAVRCSSSAGTGLFS